MTSPHRHLIASRELVTVLSNVLSQHFQERRQITALNRRVSRYSSSCTLENLEVEIDRRWQLRLVLKDLSATARLITAQQVRPHFLYHPLREIEVYRAILDQQRLGTPLCYGTMASSKPERYGLFLERISGPLLWQSGQIEHWMEAARWLAQLHSQSPTALQRLGKTSQAPLLQYDDHFYGLWLKRAEEFLAQDHGLAGLDDYRRFQRLAGHYDVVIHRLRQLPATFIHGEFYPSNIMLRRDGKGRRICVLDWELAAWAPGAIDLAALVSGDWSDQARNMMIGAYRESLDPGGGGAPSMVELKEAVDWCQLHLAVQLLGWSAHWSPPAAHAHNWLLEASRLAEKLGV